MVFKIGKHFDAQGYQHFLNTDAMGLQNILRRSQMAYDGSHKKHILWGPADHGYDEIAYAHICNADPELIVRATEIVLSWARASLELGEWKAHSIPIPEKRRLYYGPAEMHFPIRPIAWLVPHTFLLFISWLQTGSLNRAAIEEMLAKDMGNVPMLSGVWEADTLMPLSAWPQIRGLSATLTPDGHKRPPRATDRIGLMFAEDPSQLHDPKSPARKRARIHMRGSMSQRWLAPGLAITAMNWLRTIEWREGQSGLSPREVMLRAYAYMPEVEPPPNIAAEVNQLRKIPI